MTLRIAVLTTQTVHHAYFVQEICKRYPDVRVLCETEGLRPPFETAHGFETERDAYERETWFDGEEPGLEQFAPRADAPRLDAAFVDGHLGEFAPDVTLVFGTRKLSAAAIEACRSPVLNLHGGDPEAYRGLDTHLWAIYHGDFGALSTCLHVTDEHLDNGHIVGMAPIPVEPDMKIHQIRRANTEVCVKLSLDALAYHERTGRIASRPQRQAGRYYSFMPAVLKDICVDRFAAYTAGLA